MFTPMLMNAWSAEPQRRSPGQVGRANFRPALLRASRAIQNARQTSARNSAERDDHARPGRVPRRAPRTGSPCAPRADRTASARCRRARRRTTRRARSRSALCVSWKPLLNGSAHGSRKAVRRCTRYGSSRHRQHPAPTRGEHHQHVAAAARRRGTARRSRSANSTVAAPKSGSSSSSRRTRRSRPSGFSRPTESRAARSSRRTA
jgi:hypothetical protein